LTGRAPAAAQAYRAVRDRFPGSNEAARAAFSLGRIAHDGPGADPSAAARWFATYLAEAPQGSLAEEAAGRLIEARLEAHDRGGARDAAERYLRRYPGGPHAAVAERARAAD